MLESLDKIINLSDRCVILGEYIVENNTTVRSCGNHFGISKSTVHKDVTTKLKKVNMPLYIKVNEVLQRNKQERHIRGGISTKEKYKRNEKTT